MAQKKVFIFGIDGAPPELIFDRWIDELPNMKKLMDNGSYAKMNSTIPPSTIMAWNSMMSGKNPGEFDVYSYTTKDSEGKMQLTTSNNFKAERVWDTLSKEGKKSIVLNVPLTYPIKPFNGFGASGFLTPEVNGKSIYPDKFLSMIKDKFPEYQFDVSVGLASYKNIGKDEMVEKIYKMTEIQIEVLKYLLKNEEWDFGMWVCIGTDRLQHTMWSTFDEAHKDHNPNNHYKNVLKDYYKYLDTKLGEILDMLDENTTTIVVSDHGFNRMDGRVNLNDWLIKEGYMVTRNKITTTQKFDSDNIDWEKTKAYAVGAYFGRVYFNNLSEEETKRLQNEIISKLEDFRKPNGTPMRMIFHKPQEVYTGKYVKNAPSLYIYFDNLIWGVNNDLGNQGLYSELTLLGSDEGGHAPQGIFMTNASNKGNMNEIEITDIYHLIMDELHSEEEIEYVCTIGPSSDSNEVLQRLKEGGMNYARINFSHLDVHAGKELIDLLNKNDLNIIIDTRGAEIRTGKLENPIYLNEGSELKITKEKIIGNQEKICLDNPFAFDALVNGDLIKIDDARILLYVIDKKETEVTTKIVKSGLLTNNRVIFIESKSNNLPPITPEDEEIIAYGVENGVKKIVLSFVKCKEDIQFLRDKFENKIKVIAKIECPEAIENLAEIINESDEVWIDRYDLGAGMGFEKIAFLQKLIIDECKKQKTKVFVASHLLENMTFDSVPTRAEINDISNTLIDGADGFVLAGETARGKYPVKSLSTLLKIVNSAKEGSKIDVSSDLGVKEKLRQLGYI